MHFLPGADVAIELHDLPEGRLPAVWSQVEGDLGGSSAIVLA